MFKVIIASRNEADNALLQKKLSPIKKEHEVRFHSARPANLATLFDGKTNLLVYNCQHFNSSMRGHIKDWRSQGYLGPVVILVKVPNTKILDGFADLRNVTIIEKPYENKDLVGIVSKYLGEDKVSQRKHRRFLTDQKAVLESYNKDFTGDTTILNISKGGAYIVGDLTDISKGDLLRVCFDLDQIKKSRTMSAQVVWKSKHAGEHSAGLKFITKSQVYDTLLNGI